jgi:FkbM family methyltransferase
MFMRKWMVAKLQQFLSKRYNKQIIEIQDPFRDMRILLAARQITNIIDAGAYVGEIAIKLSSLFPKANIYAFEPTSSTFQKLKTNVTNFPHIKPQHFALSSRRGKAMMYLNKQDSTNSLSPTGIMGNKYQSWQTVTCSTEIVDLIPLDYWALKNKIKNIEILKLDIQGHELELLRGAKQLLKTSVRLIYSEIEFVKIYKKNCLFSEVDSFLRKYGFELFQLYNLTSGDDNRLVTGDAIFIHKDRVAL